MGRTLGIDLGTTYSAMAYLDERGQPAIIRNAEGQKTTPSVVLIEDGGFIVGQAALNQAIIKRDLVARCVKLAIGDPDWRFQGLSAVEISAEILKKLKADAEQELADSITDAVITCPAYFSSDQVEQTRQAGELAGLRVQEIVREPTAAAVYWGAANVSPGENILVCDLGGGTYDATVLSVEAVDDVVEFRPTGTTGSRELGGKHWTDKLIEYVRSQAAVLLDPAAIGEHEFEGQLADACEQAKRDLQRTSEVTIPLHYGGRAERVSVERSLFETMTEDLVAQVVDLTMEVIDKATEIRAGQGLGPIGWGDIHHVLLVGGSTRLRRVPEAIAGLTGHEPISTGEEDTMVALGAAMMTQETMTPSIPRGGLVRKKAPGAASGGLIRAVRICERNLGTKVLKYKDQEPYLDNEVVIPMGTSLPADGRRDDFATSVPNQVYIDVPVVEFDDYGGDAILDSYRFTCPPNTPKNTKVTVVFEYSKEGVCNVTTTDQRAENVLPCERVPWEEPRPEDLVAASAPRAVVMTLDTSGSMSGAKIENARRALVERATELIDAGAGDVQVGIVTFASRAQSLCDPTTDLSRIEAVARSLDTSGTTRMDLGLQAALGMLRKAPDGAAKDIAIITDGMPDSDCMTATVAAGDAARKAGVRILGIGLTVDDPRAVDEAFIRELTGGEYLMVDSAGGMSDALGRLLSG